MMRSSVLGELSQCSTPAQYERLARLLRGTGNGGALRLSVLASFSAQFLEAYLMVASHRGGVPVSPWFGPFGQFEQLVLDADSEFWRMEPEVIWLALRLEDVEPDLLAVFHELGPQAARERIAAVVERLAALARRARAQASATLFVSNLCLPPLASADPFSASDPQGLKHIISAANLRLAEALAEVSDAWVLDYDGVVAETGADRWEDARLHYLARAGLTPVAMAALAERFCRCLAAVRRPAAKCVVVDLDNTLWGGVVGDDGVGGIKVGQDYPGNVFRDIQVFLKGLRARGFLLAICSKNEQEVALEALRSHPEMVLRPEDFSACRINWEPKPANLRRIAESLNIGLDTVVFLDDNPVERAQVRAEVPQVAVPELPVNITEWLPALHRIELFDRPRLTVEDVRRADMYAAEVGRRQLEQSAVTVEEFLSSLEMEAEVGLWNEHNCDRIHQLISKTNQFNLTTRRYSKEDVRRSAEGQMSAVAWLRLRDRYGDLGLVCVGVLRNVDEGVWEVDTFVMSCRVMGRQVEDAFLAYLGEIVRDRGGRLLRGVFNPTARNIPVREFYLDRGFTPEGPGPEDETASGARRYVRPIDARPFLWPAAIARRNGAL